MSAHAKSKDQQRTHVLAREVRNVAGKHGALRLELVVNCAASLAKLYHFLGADLPTKIARAVSGTFACSSGDSIASSAAMSLRSSVTAYPSVVLESSTSSWKATAKPNQLPPSTKLPMHLRRLECDAPKLACPTTGFARPPSRSSPPVQAQFHPPKCRVQGLRKGRGQSSGWERSEGVLHS